MRNEKNSPQSVGPETQKGKQQGTNAHMVYKGNFPAKAEDSTGHNP